MISSSLICNSQAIGGRPINQFASGTRSGTTFLLTFSLIVWAGTVKATEPQERVVRFPDNRSVGCLYTRPFVREIENDWVLADDWQLLGEAQGEVRVQTDKEVRLDVTRAAALDLSFLDMLNPDDIHSLCLRSTMVDDPQLVPIGRLTGLRRLDLQATWISHRGLPHLRPLNQLIEINLNPMNTRGSWHGAGNEAIHIMVLGKWSKLEKLDLGKCQLNDSGIASLIYLKSLKSLNVAGSDVTDISMEHLKSLPRLEVLRLGLWLDRSKLTDQGLKHLGEITSLKQLDLSGADITDDGLKQLAPLTELEHLNIDWTDITNEGLANLEPLRKLKSLRFSGRHQRGNLAAEHLGKLKSLTTLSSNLHLSEQGLKTLAEHSQLESVSLVGNGITNDSLVHLRKMKSLKHLFIQSSPITDDGLTHLGELEQLESLRLWFNQITPEGLSHFKRALKLKSLRLWFDKPIPFKPGELTFRQLWDLKQLNTLELIGNGLTSKELRNVTNLSNLKVLRLQLKDPPINDDGLASIAQLTSLEELSLRTGTITDAGMEQFSRLPHLKHLELGGQFSPHGLKSLEKLRSLSHLRVSSDYVTYWDVQDLASILPYVRYATTYTEAEADGGKPRVYGTDSVQRRGTKEQRTILDELENSAPPPLSAETWIGTANEKPFDFEQAKGKVVLFYYWNKDDPEMIPLTRKLQQLFNKYRSQGLEIVSVHSTKSVAGIADFVTEQQILWPVGIDLADATAQAWRVSKSPSFHIVDHTGTLLAVDIHIPDLERAVTAYLWKKQQSQTTAR